jgi:hypothetical protein
MVLFKEEVRVSVRPRYPVDVSMLDDVSRPLCLTGVERCAEVPERCFLLAIKSMFVAG